MGWRESLDRGQEEVLQWMKDQGMPIETISEEEKKELWHILCKLSGEVVEDLRYRSLGDD